jgi:hypothetical protein
MEDEKVIKRGRDNAWENIFKSYNLDNYNFEAAPFEITAAQIKTATQHLPTTTEREVRIICKQDTRESRPEVFRERGLFILPIRNGKYAIVKGEGYINIPEITGMLTHYSSRLDFVLDTSKVGNSEMQHLDFAYASSLVREFLNDESLVMTIRGRKYTPNFTFFVGDQEIKVSGVQTEVDAGYEGRDQVILVEAKASKTRNTIIRQLYYPFRQWSYYTEKPVSTVFFERSGDRHYMFWQFTFTDKESYNSIEVVRTGKFEIDDQK